MEQESYKKIGEQIINARKEQGLTQAVLAKKSGLSQTAICLVERGGKNSNLNTLAKIADALGMEYALTEKGHEKLKNSIAYYDVEKEKTLQCITGHATTPDNGEMVILQGKRYRVTNKVFRVSRTTNNVLVSVIEE